MEIPLPPNVSDNTLTEVSQFLLALAMFEGEQDYASVRKVVDRWIAMRVHPDMVKLQMDMEQEKRERKKGEEAMRQFMNIFMAGSSGQVINGDAHDTKIHY